MYLKNIVIKNIGPIEELSIEFPFHKDGNPKPIIFVGENGSGKTILLSHIVNFFMSLKSIGFENNELNTGRVFKVRSPEYIKSGKEFYYTKISLQDQNFYLIEWQLRNIKNEFKKEENPNEYYEDEAFDLMKGNESSSFFSSFQNQKDEITALFNQNCCIYFPSNRFEDPAWLNTEDWLHAPVFEDPEKEFRRTKRKIIQQKPLIDIKNWLMDLLFDQNIYERTMVPITFPDGREEIGWIYSDEGRNKIIRDQISDFLNKLFDIDGDEKLRLGFGNKYSRNITIMEGSKVKVPNIFNLSTGELCLLDIFAGIIRDYDLTGTELKTIQDIKGVVVIDEIDLHLHTKLQSKILPKLIQLFPKIQFIITTHSPIFLLGMEKTFDKGNFEIRNMPKGEIITTERFSEFENAYEVLKDTVRFEEEVKKQISSSKKPILLLEGKTDKKIFEKAWEELEKEGAFPYHIIDIKSINGHNADHVKRELLIADVYETKFVFGIFDFDEEGYNQWNGLPENWIVTKDIKYIKKHKTKDYYALLLPSWHKNFKNSLLKNQITESQDSIFAIEHMFYDRLTPTQQDLYFKDTKRYGGTSIYLKNGKKQEFCTWICKNGTPDHFANFKVIFTILEDILNPSS